MRMLTPRLDRRSILRSASASLLLPSLASLNFAQSASALSPGQTAAKAPVKRLCTVFFGMGVSLPPEGHVSHKDWHWFPHKTGADYVLNNPLKPLSGLRDQFSILSGLSHPRIRTMYSHSTGAYFLSGADPELPAGNSISLDQVYAQYVGAETRYPYITLGSEGGIGDFRLPNTLSYNSAGQPIPSIGTPRAVFDELFGVQQGDRASIKRAYGRDRSILDAVSADLKTIKRDLAYEDKARLEQYLHAVRSMEERVERAEAWLDVEKPKMSADKFKLDVDPMRDGPTDFIDSMYNLIHASFVTDSTRTVNYMKVKESAGGLAAKFPIALGLPHHHTLSHEFNSEGGYERWSRYDQYLTERFAGFLNQLATTDDPHGEGSLLDNTIVLYGSGTSNVHNTRNYPIIVAGGKNLGLKHGAFHNYPESVPFSNLLLTLVQQLGAPVENFSDSTGTISEIIA